jgi:hypothetical protein
VAQKNPALAALNLCMNAHVPKFAHAGMTYTHRALQALAGKNNNNNNNNKAETK